MKLLGSLRLGVIGESCTYIQQFPTVTCSNIQKELGADENNDQDEDGDASNQHEKERTPTRALAIVGTGPTAK
jgi:hypothetical protein